MSLRYKDSEGNWVTGNKAIETTIVDSEGNFESSNVEGALRELAEKTKSNSDVASIEAAVKSNTTKITQLLRRIKTLTYCYKVETADKIQYNKIIFPFDMMKSKDTYLYEIDRIKKVRATGNDTEISKLANLITYTFTSNEILK